MVGILRMRIEEGIRMNESRIKDPWFKLKGDGGMVHILECEGGCGELVRTDNLNEYSCGDCFAVALVETNVVHGHADIEDFSVAIECRKCKKSESATCSEETRKFQYDDNGEVEEVDIHVPTWKCKECGHEFRECEDWYILSSVIPHCTIEQALSYLDGKKL